MVRGILHAAGVMSPLPARGGGEGVCVWCAGDRE